MLQEICDTLAKGEGVKLSGFGVFAVRHKGERVGRNPKTGAVVPIEPRQSITFSASSNAKGSRERGFFPAVEHLLARP